MLSNSDPVGAHTPHPPSGPGVPVTAPQQANAHASNFGGSADACNNFANVPRIRKEPRVFTTPSSAATSSTSPMLLGVSKLPFYTIQHLNTNTFVPSCLVLFAILAELDVNMSNTHSFLQLAPNWIPLISQAYIAVLFYIHVFRISRESNIVTPEQLQLLIWFESVYDLKTMIIPGPLVPIFQSLAFTSGPFKRIRKISPYIPDTARPIKSESYSPNNGLNTVLPNICLIVDQLQWFLNDFKITPQNENFIADNFFSNIYSTPATAGSFGLFALSAPNARFNVPVSSAQYRTFKSQASSFTFPGRLNSSSANAQLSWFEALRFRNQGTSSCTCHWFSTVSAVMQRYCQFVRGSVPMSAVPLTGLGACTPVFSYLPATGLTTASTLVSKVSSNDSNNNEIVQNAAHFSAFRPISLAAIGNHNDFELVELAEQFAAASQVNVSFSLLDNNEIFPSDNALRQGIIWSLYNVRSSPIVDVIPTHGPLIMTHYHSNSRIM